MKKMEFARPPAHGPTACQSTYSLPCGRFEDCLFSRNAPALWCLGAVNPSVQEPSMKVVTFWLPQDPPKSLKIRFLQALMPIQVSSFWHHFCSRPSKINFWLIFQPFQNAQDARSRLKDASKTRFDWILEAKLQPS